MNWMTELKSKLMYAFVVASAIGLIIADLFVGVTIYTKGDILIKSVGNAKDIANAIGYIMYILVILFANMIVLVLDILFLHQKLRMYETNAEEDEDDE